MTPCNHEETNTRIFSQVKELVLKCHKVALVGTVDTDVVVIVIFCFNENVIYLVWRLFDDVKQVFETYSPHSQHTQFNNSKKRVIPPLTFYRINNTSMIPLVLYFPSCWFLCWFSVFKFSKYFNDFIYMWTQAMQLMQMLPPIESWDWSEKLEIVWMTLPETANALSILKHCSGKPGCKGIWIS